MTPNSDPSYKARAVPLAHAPVAQQAPAWCYARFGERVVPDRGTPRHFGDKLDASQAWFDLRQGFASGQLSELI